MSFVCPNCGFQKALRVVESITLPPDSRSDDIILQIVRCDLCRFRGAAVYQESRRGNPDSESWDHVGYELDDEDVNRLSSTISQCPAKKDKDCRCRSHKTLGQRNEYGRWMLPGNIDWGETFPMRIR
jgi:hypothetical protein